MRQRDYPEPGSAAGHKFPIRGASIIRALDSREVGLRIAGVARRMDPEKDTRRDIRIPEKYDNPREDTDNERRMDESGV